MIMKTNLSLALVAVSQCLLALTTQGASPLPSMSKPAVIVSTSAEPVADGPFQPTWQSLEQYRVPDWFRDAKFGIWAHWGPQCEPEAGDWYARSMYQEGSKDNKFHIAHYGPPSVFGFKDVINEWKGAELEAGRPRLALQAGRRAILLRNGEPSRQSGPVEK